MTFSDGFCQACLTFHENNLRLGPLTICHDCRDKHFTKDEYTKSEVESILRKLYDEREEK